MPKDKQSYNKVLWSNGPDLQFTQLDYIQKHKVSYLGF